jgi:rhodanese-related sulfurtransferase
MFKKSFFVAVIIIMAPIFGFAAGSDDLIKKGDDYFSSANYIEAVSNYKKALLSNPDSIEINKRLETAIIAKNADEFFTLLTRDVQKKMDIRIKVDDLLKMMAEGKKKITLIDVRTPQEQAAVISPKALKIPLYDVIKNLNQIPADGIVVVICHSGPRAMIAATALRILGYNNVYALNGGIHALADVTAKTAPDNLK